MLVLVILLVLHLVIVLVSVLLLILVSVLVVVITSVTISLSISFSITFSIIFSTHRNTIFLRSKTVTIQISPIGIHVRTGKLWRDRKTSVNFQFVEFQSLFCRSRSERPANKHSRKQRTSQVLLLNRPETQQTLKLLYSYYYFHVNDTQR